MEKTLSLNKPRRCGSVRAKLSVLNRAVIACSSFRSNREAEARRRETRLWPLLAGVISIGVLSEWDLFIDGGIPERSVPSGGAGDVSDGEVPNRFWTSWEEKGADEEDLPGGSLGGAKLDGDLTPVGGNDPGETLFELMLAHACSD